MKKWLKIVLGILGSMIFAIILVVIFRGAIISYVLEKVISKKSDEKVKLHISEFKFGFDGTFIIEQPELEMIDVYLNDSKNMSIDRIVFNKIEIDFLNLKILVFDRDITAARLLIDKPEFYFTETGTTTKSSFHPEKLFDLLNHNPGLFKTLNVEIGDIEIHYGSINISEYTSPDVDPGLVDFTIMLHGFNSALKDDSVNNRILFSEEILFKLKDLNRKLKSGYTVLMDSAVFSSKKRDLEIGGVSLIPGEENLEGNAIQLFAGRLVLNDVGLDEVRGMEDLSLSSVYLSDGYLSTFRMREQKERKPADTSKNLVPLEQLFYDFLLDSISINHFEYYNIVERLDTTISANDINFLITGIEIDSSMLDNPLRKFVYKRIKLSTGSIDLNEMIEGLNVSYSKLSYANDDRILRISDIEVEADSVKNNNDHIAVGVEEIQLDGFSLRSFRVEQQQDLILTIINPEIDLEFDRWFKSSNQTRAGPIIPDYLQLEKIIVQKGNVHFEVRDSMSVDLRGLDISVSKLHLPDDVNTDLQYEDLIFGYENLEALLENKKIKIVTGAMHYEKQGLRLNKIESFFKHDTLADPLEFTAGFLEMNKFDLDRLIAKKEFVTGGIFLYRPIVKGDFGKASANNKDSHSSEEKEFEIPTRIRVGATILKQGYADVDLEVEEENLKVKTNFNVELGKISLRKGDPASVILKQLMWNVLLTKTKADYKGHDLQLRSFKTSSYTSELIVDSLAITSQKNTIRNKSDIEVRSLFIPLTNIAGLDYSLLVLQDSVKFRSLTIKDPVVDILLPKSTKKKQADPDRIIDLRPYLIFNYDTVSLASLHLNIELPGDSSYYKIATENFEIGHINKRLESGNLIKDIIFKFSSFSFVDTVSGKYYRVKNGNIDPLNSKLTLEGIESSNVKRAYSEQDQNQKGSYKFYLSEMKLDHIFVSDELPSHVQIGKLFIGDLEMDILSEAEKKEKTPFILDLKFLKQFTGIVTRFNIDTTDLNDISFRSRKISDTLTHIINFDSIAIVAKNILIDSSMIGQPDPPIIDRLTIDLRNRKHYSADSLYEIKTGRLHYDFARHQVIVDSFYVIPRYPDSVFFEKAVYQTDRMNIFGKKIEINNINVNDFLLNNHLYMGSVFLDEFNIDMYRDKKYPIKPGLYKKMPRELITGLKQSLTIDTIWLRNSRLDYKEFGEKSEKPGSIFLSDLDISGFGLTNKIPEGDRNTRLKVDVNAQIMGNSKMHIAMFFPLYTDTIAFWLSGSTEDIEMTQLSSMTENLLGIGITEGVGNVNIPLIIANDSSSYGTLLFKYKKLRLALYDRKKEELNPSFFSPVVNFFINDLVVRSNNPRFARRTKTGIVYFKRDTRKGIVNYAWKSILSGMLSTIGINNKGQKQERKEIKRQQE